MKNFIKELYYGNIDPQARGFKNGSYLKKQMTILSESEALLTDRLTGDEKKMFLTFVNASDIILGESELDKEAIRSINEYLDLIEERKTEDRFLDRVTTTIQDNLKALTPLLNLLTLTQPVAQPQQAVPVSEEKDSAAEENMLEFLEGF